MKNVVRSGVMANLLEKNAINVYERICWIITEKFVFKILYFKRMLKYLTTVMFATGVWNI